MANVDNPHGLAPLNRTLSGGAPAVMPFVKDASATVVYINDVIQRDADGGVSAGISTPLVGVSLHWSAASTAAELLVMCDPHAVYEAQDNADSDGFALVDMGANCNIEANSGSTTTYISGHELDESTAATTNTCHVHLIRLFPVVSGNAYGNHARIEVNFSAAALGSAVAGITT